MNGEHAETGARTAPAPGAGPHIAVTLAVGQRPELPVTGDRAMHAIVEIGVRSHDTPPLAASGTGGPGGPALAEVLIVDTSRSMLHPPDKLHAAKDATVAALRRLPEGSAFAVLSGRFGAGVVHPGPGRESMALAGPAEREAAERAVRLLDADGGTAIGPWLDLARRLLNERTAPVKHVLLLTDGRNEHDRRADIGLDTALEACDGRFVCDAWGIGEDWDADLLLRITRRLHGRAGAVRDVSELASVYEELMNGLLGTAVPELRIRLTPTPGTVIRRVTQVVPNEQELAPVAAPFRERGAEYVTRAWSEETRHFQVVLTADPSGRDIGEDLQLAAVEVVVPDFGRPVLLPDPRPVLVRWTDDPYDASRQHPGVRRHELYQQASAAVARAYRAWLRRAEGADEADRELGRALALAAELGDTQLLGALRRIEVTAGTGKIRTGLKDVDWQHLILSSALTTPPRQPSPAGSPRETEPAASEDGTDGTGGTGGADGPAELTECPGCGWIGPADSAYCGGDCGRPLGRPLGGTA
ncbi:VWA domain-containing protein [Streptomyces sp. J2-1]|uniref:VWA domain-containing protein n=1 Tax=Streptomyces corallincola TaxID=2851888 RepID=UPI001C381D59|nr:VWA domain-containing protein [Streptomyces corallincola]MBV2355716.1 VWA domain-containing protein [Streptomyces corallincola]